MSGEGQFGVDEQALRKAIGKLKDTRDRARNLARSATSIGPGELTALDGTTGNARLTFQDRMTGSDGSLQSAAEEIEKRLDEKISAYEAALGEYGRAEDNATVAGRRLEGQA